MGRKFFSVMQCCVSKFEWLTYIFMNYEFMSVFFSSLTAHSLEI